MTFKALSRSSALSIPSLEELFTRDHKSRLYLFSEKNSLNDLEGVSRSLAMAQYNTPHITFC